MNAAASVLIVEDERIVAQDLQQTLQQMGYDAFAIASSADEALMQAEKRRPDVVLMDIRIKGPRDGVQTAEILSRDHGVAVVYLTAHADEATLLRAKQTNPYGYLVKPVKVTELRSVVEISVHKHRADRLVRERERWLETTLESIGDAVLTVDDTGRVNFFNRQAERLTGIARADAQGRPVHEVVPLLGVDLGAVFRRALEERLGSSISEATLDRREVGPCLISDSVAPVLDAEHVLGAVMVFRDVSAEKEAARRRELSERLASLGTMTAGVAHELRTPLAVILANAEVTAAETRDLLAEMLVNEDSRRQLVETLHRTVLTQEDIVDAVTRIAGIVRQLTDLVRPKEAGVADVARAIAWATRATAAELRPRAELVLELAADLPRVSLDEQSLTQVLVNLLTNAARSIPEGKPNQHRVTVSVQAQDELLAIEVGDTGHGITQADLARLFEPFFSTRHRTGGTGLGLSICHELVHAVGGRIEVETEVGEGSLFRVLLPIATEPHAPNLS